MPFIDLNEVRQVGDKDYDFTIVGAGAAGILLAIKLSRKGYEVRVIESGHFNLDEKRQILNEVECSAKKLENAVWGRKRAIGGTTIAWGGQSLPFRPIDFEKRDWVKLSGWPIAFDEVSKYYTEANTFMNIDDWGYDAAMLEKINLKDQFKGQDELDYHVSKWANEPNFFKLYKKELEEKTDIYYNALLQQISFDNERRASSVYVSNFSGKEFLLKTNKLIICAGGIETVRLMLLNSKEPSQWLGKCFMEHPCIEVADVVPRKMFELQKLFNTHIYDGRRYSLRLSLSQEMQKKNGLLNCSASIMFTPPEGKPNIYAEMKAFRNDKKFKRLIRISGNLPGLAKSLTTYIFNRFYYKADALAKLSLMIEQEPQAESNISLGNSSDLFGKKKANIHWSISEKTWKTAVAISTAVKKLLESRGIAQVNIYPSIKDGNTKYQDLLSDVNHHMGGTRMCNSPHSGVVDTDLKVWNTNNLYLCSTSVFPTVSHSNPTLTLLALGCRLVDHLT